MIRKLVRTQYNRSLAEKLKKEGKKLKKDKIELQEYSLYKREVKPIHRSVWIEVEDGPVLGVEAGALYNNLKKNWTGFRIGKNKDGKDREYAGRIKSIQKKIGYNVTEFNLED